MLAVLCKYDKDCIAQLKELLVIAEGSLVIVVS